MEKTFYVATEPTASKPSLLDRLIEKTVNLLLIYSGISFLFSIAFSVCDGKYAANFNQIIISPAKILCGNCMTIGYIVPLILLVATTLVSLFTRKYFSKYLELKIALLFIIIMIVAAQNSTYRKKALPQPKDSAEIKYTNKSTEQFGLFYFYPLHDTMRTYGFSRRVK